jgi:hypothetical protein
VRVLYRLSGLSPRNICNVRSGNARPQCSDHKTLFFVCTGTYSWIVCKFPMQLFRFARRPEQKLPGPGDRPQCPTTTEGLRRRDGERRARNLSLDEFLIGDENLSQNGTKIIKRGVTLFFLSFERLRQNIKGVY